MGINMDKMRARMEALQGNGNNKKNNFWKPQEGEQTIRLVAQRMPCRHPKPFQQ